MSVTIDNMREQLLTVDQLRQELSVLEPLGAYGFPVSDQVSFRAEPGWNHGEVLPPDPVPVYVRVPGAPDEIQLTSEAVYQATSLVSMGAGLVKKLPADLLAQTLNYFYQSGQSEKSNFQVLSVEGTQRTDQAPLGVAFVRGSIRPFSSLRLLDTALERIRGKYDAREEDLLVDYKRKVSLPYTAFALVIPEVVRQMRGTGLDDDPWSVGVRIMNSPTGKGATAAEGYLFRYVCTNGEITLGADSGKWQRRDGQGEEVYVWAEAAVDAVLGGLESELDNAQRLVDIPVGGEAAAVLADLYDHFRLPTPVRNDITNRMVEVTDLNMYHLKSAVTEAANDTDLPAATQEQIMRVGGFVNHAATSRCASCHQILRGVKAAQPQEELHTGVN